MTIGEEAVRDAAAVALDIPMDEVVALSGSEVRAKGEPWQVTPAPLDGLGESGCPDVLIVAPLRGDDPERAAWVARLPGRGFVPLSDPGALADLFSACEGLPAETIARLIAINLGPRGAEAVVVRGDELDVVLGARAGAVPGPERLPRLVRSNAGRWDLHFVAYRTYPGGAGLLASASTWHAVFENGALRFDRDEFVTDAPFPPH